MRADCWRLFVICFFCQIGVSHDNHNFLSNISQNNPAVCNSSIIRSRFHCLVHRMFSSVNRFLQTIFISFFTNRPDKDGNSQFEEKTDNCHLSVCTAGRNKYFSFTDTDHVCVCGALNSFPKIILNFSEIEVLSKMDTYVFKKVFSPRSNN